MAEQRGVRVHEYNTSAYAYDETQTNDEIWDGDVIIALEEGAVAILDEAWPFAITEAHGEFHGPPHTSAHLIRDGRFTESLAVALDKARELGFAVHPLNAPVITPAPEPDPVREREYPCPSCDGYGGFELYDNNDAIIGWEPCPDRHNHPISLVKPPKPAPFRHLEGCDGSGFTRADCCPPF